MTPIRRVARRLRALACLAFWAVAAPGRPVPGRPSAAGHNRAVFRAGLDRDARPAIPRGRDAWYYLDGPLVLGGPDRRTP